MFCTLTTQIYEAMLLGPWLSMAGDKKVGNLMAKLDRQDLATVTSLIEAGQVKPVIDQRFPLEAVAEAIRYYEKGRTRGKLVITITP